MKALLALTGIILGTVGCANRAGMVPLEPPRPPGNYPQILRFVAHPSVIHRGEKVILQWNARNAEQVLIEQAVDPNADIRANFESLGTFPASGTLEVHPKRSTSYVLTCGNEIIGCSTASAHVIVK